jgi:DNA primase
MFPICDEQGRVIGFSGRILSGDDKTAKYVNSPETPIFTKSKVFFGLDKSKRAVLDAGFAIICEGQLDLIACFMAGVKNIVAPQGTAFTADHARILKRYVDEVVLCFDSDEAGQNAAVRSLDHLLASGLAVRVAVVPAPHDPDSFIKANGGEAFRRLIGQAEGFFDYYLRRLCALNEPSTDKGRMAILRGMAEAVHKTGSAALVDKYAQKTALRVGVEPDAVRTEFKKARRFGTDAPGEPRETEDAEPPQAQIPEKERWLLEILLTCDEHVAWVAERLDLAWIQDPLARKIVAARLSACREKSWHSIAGFLDSIGDEDAGRLITEVTASQRTILNPEKLLKGDPGLSDKRGILEILRDEHLDREIVSLKHRLNHPEIPDAERIELLRQQQKLREQKRAPLAPPG